MGHVPHMLAERYIVVPLRWLVLCLYKKKKKNGSSQKMVSIVSSHIAWKWRCAYMYNAPFMTQRVLKPWWSWTYQNSVVKRASARAIPGWVTSWEVWYGELKADNIVSLGVGRYKWYQSYCPAWDGGSVHKPMRDASGDAGSKEGVIGSSHIAWKWRCAYMYNAPFMTQRVLKPWWSWTY